MDIGSNHTNEDLSGIDLSGQDLRACQFVGANLSGADLSGADLRGVSFAYADLSGVDFSGADLRGVGFFAAEYDRDKALSEAKVNGAQRRAM